MDTARRWITKDRQFYRSLAALAIPVALQNLITFAVNFADNLMVGALGDAAISGVYLGGQIQTLLQLFSGGVEGAILILAAQYWGKRETQSSSASSPSACIFRSPSVCCSQPPASACRGRSSASLRRIPP